MQSFSLLSVFSKCKRSRPSSCLDEARPPKRIGIHPNIPFRNNHISLELRMKVAKYLENECQNAEEKSLPSDPKKITWFHSVVDPKTTSDNMTITKYFNRLADYLPMTDKAIITAIYFMNCMRKTTPFNNFTVHRLLLIAWYVAAKYFNIIKKDEEFLHVGGISEQEELKKLVSIVKRNPLIKSFSSYSGRHYEMLGFLLNDEINHDAFESTRTILNNYLPKDLCGIVSSYITANKTSPPGKDLEYYVSYFQFRLFSPKVSDVEFSSGVKKPLLIENRENPDEDEVMSISEAEKRWEGLAPSS